MWEVDEKRLIRCRLLLLLEAYMRVRERKPCNLNQAIKEFIASQFIVEVNFYILLHPRGNVAICGNIAAIYLLPAFLLLLPVACVV